VLRAVRRPASYLEVRQPDLPTNPYSASGKRRWKREMEKSVEARYART
jgi:hypothetical protein